MQNAATTPLDQLLVEVAARADARNGEVVRRVISFWENPANWVSDFPDIDRDYTPAVAKYLRDQAGEKRCRFMAMVDQAIGLDDQVQRHYDKMSWNREWELRLTELVSRRWATWTALADGKAGHACGRCYQCFGITHNGRSLIAYEEMIRDYVEEMKNAVHDIARPRDLLEKITVKVAGDQWLRERLPDDRGDTGRGSAEADSGQPQGAGEGDPPSGGGGWYMP